MVRIALFGQPRVVSEDGSRDFALPRKTLNVLSYLILKSTRPPARDAVAFALFPDEDEEKARGSLRRNLSYLLSSLPPPENGEPYVHADADRVYWNLAAPAQVDVLAFERALAEGRDDDALAQYAGPLLPTLYDDWTTAHRERLRDAAHDALGRTIARDRSLRRFDAATASAHRLLEDDPWREDIVRQLIGIRYEAGDRAGALATFAQFAARVHDELGAEPMDETLALREAVLRGARLATSEPAAEKRPRVLGALPFVGRNEAMAQALERWHTSADGRAGMLFLAGEAGIGKSRFAAEFARAIEREGGMSIIGETAAGGERRPYEAVVEALRYANPTPSVDQLLDEQAQATLSDDRSARVRLFESMQKAVLKIARRRPLAIVIEDLHWAGPATMELVGYLIDRLATAPVLFVGTYRDEELPPAHPLRGLVRDGIRSGSATRLTLNRLDRSDAIRAAVEAVPPGVTRDAVEAAAAWSEGVPLLLSEVVQDLAAGRDFNAGAFLGVIGERFAGLGEDAATALTYAAVLGARFELETLGAATGWRDDELVDALAPSIELGIIRADRRRRSLTFAFSHHVIHAAMLARIPAEDRGRIHLLVARALAARFTGDDQAVEIAQHYAAAGDTRRAAQKYAIGARYALNVFANVDARDAATAGLALTTTADEDRELRYALVATRERAFARIGAPAERRADAELLSELAAPDEKRLGAALERLVEALRSDKPAQRLVLARLESLAGTSRHAAGIFDIVTAREENLDGDFRASAVSALRAAQRYEASGDHDAALRARLLHVSALVFLGEHAQAWSSLTEIRPAAEACEDLSLRREFYYIACSTGVDGRRDLAFADAERALELAQLIGDRYAEAQARHSVGWAATAIGDHARGVSEYERAIRTYNEIGCSHDAVGTIFNLASEHGWSGDYEGAFRLMDHLDSLGIDQPWITLQSHAHRGSLFLRAGELANAERHLLAARELSSQLGIGAYRAHLQSCMGELAARRGRFAEARSEFDAAASALEQLDFTVAAAEARAFLARVQAEMHDEPAARAAIVAAAASAAAAPPLGLSSRFWWNLAAASALLGDAAADEFARRAARVFCGEAMSMPPDLAESYGRLPWNIDTFAYLAGRNVSLTLVA